MNLKRTVRRTSARPEPVETGLPVPRRVTRELREKLVGESVLRDNEKTAFFKGEGHEVVPNPFRNQFRNRGKTNGLRDADLVLVATRYLPSRSNRGVKPEIQSVRVIGAVIDSGFKAVLGPKFASRIEKILVPGLVLYPGTAPARLGKFEEKRTPFEYRIIRPDPVLSAKFTKAILKAKQANPHWGGLHFNAFSLDLHA